MNDTNFTLQYVLERVKTLLKRLIIFLYCHHYLSPRAVAWLFRHIDLKSA